MFLFKFTGIHVISSGFGKPSAIKCFKSVFWLLYIVGSKHNNLQAEFLYIQEHCICTHTRALHFAIKKSILPLVGSQSWTRSCQHFMMFSCNMDFSGNMQDTKTLCSRGQEPNLDILQQKKAEDSHSRTDLEKLRFIYRYMHIFYSF